MLAQQCNMELGEVIVSIGDSHIYNNHQEQVAEQLSRTPKQLPKLKILTKPKDIYSYKFKDFELENYEADAHIPAKVSI
jgi:thymidylate synthase